MTTQDHRNGMQGLRAVVVALGITFAVLLSCLESCNPATKAITAMSITDATDLFIAPYSGTKGAGNNTLFKITSAGSVQEVAYTDANGDQTTFAYPPSAVFNVNSTYVVVCFSPSGYLVRKSDGAVFS